VEVTATVSNCSVYVNSAGVRVGMVSSMAGALDVPESWVTVDATCLDDSAARRLTTSGNVKFEYLVSIPTNADSNLSAYNASSVASEIGNGTNTSNTEDYFNAITQVITLNVAKAAESLSTEDVTAQVKEASEAAGFEEDVQVEEVAEPVIRVITTTSTSTSTSSSTSSETSTTLSTTSSSGSSSTTLSTTSSSGSSSTTLSTTSSSGSSSTSSGSTLSSTSSSESSTTAGTAATGGTGPTEATQPGTSTSAAGTSGTAAATVTTTVAANFDYAEVTFAVLLTVTNQDSFVNDADVIAALRDVMAEELGIAASSIEVVLSTQRRLRAAASARRLTSGSNIRAEFTITSGQTDAPEVADNVANLDTSSLTSLLSDQLGTSYDIDVDNVQEIATAYFTTSGASSRSSTSSSGLSTTSSASSSSSSRTTMTSEETESSGGTHTTVASSTAAATSTSSYGTLVDGEDPSSGSSAGVLAAVLVSVAVAIVVPTTVVSFYVQRKASHEGTNCVSACLDIFGSWGGAERLDDDGASQDLEEGRNAANDGREDLDITSPRRTLEGAPRVDVDVEDDASEVDSMAPVEEAQGGASHLEGVVRDGWFEHEV